MDSYVMIDNKLLGVCLTNTKVSYYLCRSIYDYECRVDGDNHTTSFQIFTQRIVLER